jgi:predicted dehydrogenase
MPTHQPQRIRYAVIGLGNIAQVAVLPAFAHARENSELVALVSGDRAKLHALGERYRVPVTGTYEELERVIEEARVDAVYVAVPNAFHCEITGRAARAGAHVLCEKPMATTVEDCQQMIRATKASGVKLMVAYRLHFEQANLRAIARIRSGAIGEPRIFSSVFCHQVREGNIRTRDDLGGGALFDMGIYCLNAARYLFQDEPVEVYAAQVHGTDPRFADVDEMTTAVLRFPGERLAQMTASQGAAEVSEYQVVGTKGQLRLDPAYEYMGHLREVLTVEGETTQHTFPERDQFAPELVYFSRCILENVEPVPSGYEGLEDVRILQAMVRSAQTGAKVTLSRADRHVRPDEGLEMNKPPVDRVLPFHAPAPSR